MFVTELGWAECLLVWPLALGRTVIVVDNLVLLMKFTKRLRFILLSWYISSLILSDIKIMIGHVIFVYHLVKISRLKFFWYDSNSNKYNCYAVQSKPLKNLNGQICQICGDAVGLTATGDVFVACHECAFSLCHRCYEYEWKNGNQSCPQCKTRCKSHKGASLCIYVIIKVLVLIRICNKMNLVCRGSSCRGRWWWRWCWWSREWGQLWPRK